MAMKNNANQDQSKANATSQANVFMIKRLESDKNSFQLHIKTSD